MLFFVTDLYLSKYLTNPVLVYRVIQIADKSCASGFVWILFCFLHKIWLCGWTIPSGSIAGCCFIYRTSMCFTNMNVRLFYYIEMLTQDNNIFHSLLIYLHYFVVNCFRNEMTSLCYSIKMRQQISFFWNYISGN